MMATPYIIGVKMKAKAPFGRSDSGPQMGLPRHLHRNNRYFNSPTCPLDHGLLLSRPRGWISKEPVAEWG